MEWLKDIRYEKHLMEGAETEKLSAARWANVLDFVDWMSKRCGGEIDDTAGVSLVSESKTLLEVIQNVSLLSTLSEREKDQNVVTLSTLHAAKGLEWPHVMLAGVTEGSLPFSRNVKKPKKSSTSSDRTEEDDEDSSVRAEPVEALGSNDEVNRLQEERRLMYVGITRARNTLMVSWTKKKKAGRDMVSAFPSRFIAEMALDAQTVREDPREKLRQLRAEFAAKAAVTAAQQTVTATP
jgi:ATP-dependent DNA helicase Rep